LIIIRWSLVVISTVDYFAMVKSTIRVILSGDGGGPSLGNTPRRVRRLMPVVLSEDLLLSSLSAPKTNLAGLLPGCAVEPAEASDTPYVRLSNNTALAVTPGQGRT